MSSSINQKCERGTQILDNPLHHYHCAALEFFPRPAVNKHLKEKYKMR